MDQGCRLCIEPRYTYSRGLMIASGNFGSESRQSQETGRQQSLTRYGQCRGHHRGQRPGHAFTGVAWELGRAICLLVQITVRKPSTNFQAHKERKPRPLCEPFIQGTRKVDGYTRYQVRKAKSEQSWDRLMAVLVDHSTDGHLVSEKVGNQGPRDPL